MNWKMTNSQLWMNCDSNLLLILKYVMTLIWVCNHLPTLKKIECLQVKSSWRKGQDLKWTQENASTFPHEMEVCGNQRKVVPRCVQYLDLGLRDQTLTNLRFFKTITKVLMNNTLKWGCIFKTNIFNTSYMVIWKFNQTFKMTHNIEMTFTRLSYIQLKIMIHF